MGGAVRGFCEWRADHYRSVYCLGGIEMAAPEWSRFTPAAWLRRPGTRTLQRPAGAVPAIMCRGQHSGLQPHHLRAVFSCFATANETQFHQASHHHDAEKLAAREVRFVTRRRIHERTL